MLWPLILWFSSQQLKTLQENPHLATIHIKPSQDLTERINVYENPSHPNALQIIEQDYIFRSGWVIFQLKQEKIPYFPSKGGVIYCPLTPKQYNQFKQRPDVQSVEYFCRRYDDTLNH